MATNDEQLAELTYQIRRLSDTIESDAERRERFERILVETLGRTEINDAQQLMLLHQLLEKPPLTREDVLGALRMAADEIRQGLGLRALGASPWPTAVPPSEVPQKESTLKFEVNKGGGTVLTLPPLTWRGTLTAVKYTVTIAMAGTSVVLMLRAVYFAIMGHIE